MEGKGERRSGCNNFPFTPVFETPKRGSGGSASRWGLSPTPPTLAPLPLDPGDATVSRFTVFSTIFPAGLSTHFVLTSCASDSLLAEYCARLQIIFTYLLVSTKNHKNNG